MRIFLNALVQDEFATRANPTVRCRKVDDTAATDVQTGASYTIEQEEPLAYLVTHKEVEADFRDADRILTALLQCDVLRRERCSTATHRSLAELLSELRREKE